VIIRHYKTDWWGERRPVWTDEADYPDPDALARPLAMLLAAQENGRCVVLNPFGAVVPQNKRAMAYFWERLDSFSPRTQATVRALIPFTERLETMDLDRLRRERMDWVLKSDYGCEGDEVLVGAEATAELWDESLRLAIPGRWIAQRRFQAVTDELGRAANHGVYVVAGEPAGIYTRLSAGATDPTALSVATLVAERAR
jgi:glutathionylspermidine synthase